MNDEDLALRETFRAEVRDILPELEASLIELEKNPEADVVCAIFRGFHSMKGSGAMCGFNDISQFTHHIESVYDLVRRKKLAVGKDLVDLTLSACDLIRTMIESEQPATKEVRDREAELLASLKALVPVVQPGAADRDIPLPECPQEKQITYRIRFRPRPDIFLRGMDPLLLLAELRALGECTVAAHTDQIPDLHVIDPEKCYTYWDVILTTDRGTNAIKDVFIFIEDECELKIDVIDDGENSDSIDYRTLGQILVEKRDLAPEDLEQALRQRKLLGQTLLDMGLVKPQIVEAALAEQERVRELRQSRQSKEALTSIRVSSDKLDRLVNLIGELVTAQARLSRAAFLKNDPDLVSIAEEVERLVGDLRANTMEIRMMPIGTLFTVFKRLVRDLSRELCKEVELETIGGETELDKTLLEKLNDPLVHLIRNSIDHGIETPDARERAGKPRQGTIHLGAAHTGDSVVIEIRDDGAGLDSEVIRSVAVRKGLIEPGEQLTEDQIFSLILAPGFTTTRNVTNVSGRGVGLDVVKKSVNALRGSVHISSMKGVATTITLILPLTLAIVEGLLVRVGEEHFVLPLSEVEECVELARKDAGKTSGRHIANVRGQIVPYISMRDRFLIMGERPDIEQIVIVRHDNHRIGFVVDKVIGEHQTVIKTLGKVFRDIEWISGATILGDGSVALILDVAKIVEQSALEESAQMAALL
ncbi:MAG TPA: chemotaxis protein CheA [Nitrospirota bacterium]|nr:chemotaxis protein CheA [Nitrospirota bacterium]